MAASPATAAQDQCKRGMLLGLGGMPCLQRNLCAAAGVPDSRGLFRHVRTTPAVIGHCLRDDFEDFLNPDSYRYMAENREHAWHTLYSRPYQMLSLRSLDFLASWDFKAYSYMWDAVLHHGPAMFEHVSCIGGIQAQIAMLDNDVADTRAFLCKYPWKVMVWASAIPYSHLQTLAGQDPTLTICGVVNMVMRVLLIETEELYNCLIDHGCENFVLLCIVIVYGMPHYRQPQRESIRVSRAEEHQRAETYLEFFQSQLVGSQFIAADGSDAAAAEFARVTLFLLQYMEWTEWGPCLEHGQNYFHNDALGLSVWKIH